jgi:TRAP-type C4-dicarboxylate transport system substrate-binding protein
MRIHRRSRRHIGMSTAAAVACLSGSAALLGSGQAGAATVSGPTASWNYLLYESPTDPHTVQAQNFAKDVSSATGGKVTIKTVTPGQLPYQLPQFLQAVQSGGAQMADAYSTGVGGESPAANLAGLPFIATTYPQQQAFVKALTPYLATSFSKFGATLLYWYDWPTEQIYGNGSAPTSLSSFNGMKMRSEGGSVNVLEDSLGAVPVTLSTSEVATAWQSGVIQANDASDIAIIGNGWTPFVKWSYMINAGPTPSFVVVSKKAMSSLSPSERSAVLSVAKQYQAKLATSSPQLDSSSAKKLESGGVKPIAVPASVRKTLQKVAAAYATTYAQQNGLTKALQDGQKAVNGVG